MPSQVIEAFRKRCASCVVDLATASKCDRKRCLAVARGGWAQPYGRKSLRVALELPPGRHPARPWSTPDRRIGRPWWPGSALGVRNGSRARVAGLRRFGEFL